MHYLLCLKSKGSLEQLEREEALQPTRHGHSDVGACTGVCSPHKITQKGLEALRQKEGATLKENAGLHNDVISSPFPGIKWLPESNGLAAKNSSQDRRLVHMPKEMLISEM